jgi:hypothetical protein
VARVTERLHVVEVQAPRIVPSLDRHDVVAVQVALAGQLGAAQLVEHYLGRRRFDVRKPTLLHHVRLPPTPSAAPFVALKAQHPQPLVVCIVPTLDPAAATIVARSLRIFSN